MPNKLGIVACSSNRPEHFSRLVGSLADNNFSGTLVIVDGSGDGSAWTAAKTSSRQKLRLKEVKVDGSLLGRSRWNIGAQAAFDEGATHVCFPNDYQSYPINPERCLEHLRPADEVSIGIGVLLDSLNQRVEGPIWSSGLVSAKSSWFQRRSAWGSALEALMVCSRGLFETTGGWNTKIATGLPDEISPSGDGVELLFRCLENGGFVYPLSGYEIAGGHRFSEDVFSWSKYQRYGRGMMRIETYLGFPWWYKALHAGVATMRGIGLRSRDPAVFGSAEEWRARAHGMRMELSSEIGKRVSNRN